MRLWKNVARCRSLALAVLMALVGTGTAASPVKRAGTTCGAWRACKVGGGGYLQNVVAGDLKEALTAIPSFDNNGKQVGWTTLLDARAAGEWRPFSREVQLPKGAARSSLIVTFNGNGKVWLDEVRVDSAPALFPALAGGR